MEALPDVRAGDGEVEWVSQLIREGKCDNVKAIVASVNLAEDDSKVVEEELIKVCKASLLGKRCEDEEDVGLVVGVRWICDYVGPYTMDNATHVATTRCYPNGVDYLRSMSGGSDGSENVDASIKFERGFALLEKFGLSFDLQCAPEQLPAAALLFAKYPNIPVCIDHLGKPMMVLGSGDDDNKNSMPDADKLNVWKDGLRRMAMLSHVYIKISMLGWAVPGWWRIKDRELVMRDLVREVVTMFGADRVMVGSNWHGDAGCSDNDGLDNNGGPSASELITKVSLFFVDDDGKSLISCEDRERIFSKTAQSFYDTRRRRMVK